MFVQSSRNVYITAMRLEKHGTEQQGVFIDGESLIQRRPCFCRLSGKGFFFMCLPNTTLTSLLPAVMKHFTTKLGSSYASIWEYLQLFLSDVALPVLSKTHFCLLQNPRITQPFMDCTAFPTRQYDNQRGLQTAQLRVTRYPSRGT